jgi:hypothetical protein
MKFGDARKEFKGKGLKDNNMLFNAAPYNADSI